MANVGTYRLLMDERWSLEDLHLFPHAFDYAYTFTYCFENPSLPISPERIDRAIEEYPFQGGYSYVNLYFVLKHQVVPEERPAIRSIQYASPGWIELLLNPDVAMQVAGSVSALLGMGYAAVEAFKRIDKVRLEVARTRKEAGVEILKLEADQIAALRRLCDETAKHIGFKNIDNLHRRTKDPEISLKLLMAHWRKLAVLVEYVHNGKAQLPEERDHEEPIIR